jgi:U2-associated protein SR140
MSHRIDLAAFRDSDSDDDLPKPKPTLAAQQLTAAKSKAFAHGITKKTKKDLEKEAEERKRVEEEK